MKILIAIIFTIIIVPIFSYALPESTLIGIKATADPDKIEKVETAFRNKNLVIYWTEYVHTPTGNIWLIANFHTEQFIGNVSQAWIDAVKEAVAEDPDIKLEFTADAAQTLKDKNMKQNGTP